MSGSSQQNQLYWCSPVCSLLATQGQHCRHLSFQVSVPWSMKSVYKEWLGLTAIQPMTTATVTDRLWNHAFVFWTAVDSRSAMHMVMTNLQVYDHSNADGLFLIRACFFWLKAVDSSIYGANIPRQWCRFTTTATLTKWFILLVHGFQLIAVDSSIHYANRHNSVQVHRVRALWKLGAACGGVSGFGAWAGVLGNSRPWTSQGE